MVDNRKNYFGVAPDKGFLNGPIASFQNQTEFHEQNASYHKSHGKRQATGTYWMETITHGQVSTSAKELPGCPLGSQPQMPLAPSGYNFFRNVKDFGAKGDGVTE